MYTALLCLGWACCGQFSGNVTDPPATATPAADAPPVLGPAFELPPGTGTLNPPEPTAAPAPSRAATRSIYEIPADQPPAAVPSLGRQPDLDFPATGESHPLPDGDRRPATGDAPPDSTEPGTAIGKSAAAAVLHQALSTLPEHPVPGKPIALGTMLQRIGDAAQRPRAVDAYWRLAAAAAAYRFAAEEVEFLLGLPEPRDAAQMAMLNAKRANARAGAAETRLAALRAQRELAGILGPTAAGELPLTADLPFVGRYQTHFEALRARGLASEEWRAAAELLPALQELIERQADATVANGQALDAIQQAYHTGQMPLATVLETHDTWRLQRRAFLASVQDYNQQIARYAFAVASPTLSSERVVGMLIETANRDHSVLVKQNSDSGIRRVSNEEPLAPQNRDGWTERP